MNRTPLKSKRSSELSVAKKLLLLLFLLWMLLPSFGGAGGGGLLAAVQVKNIGTDYANKRVTFSISWAAGTRDATHLSKVWVLVDYREVINNYTSGAWQRATVVSATASKGTVSYDGSNRQGFFVQGAAGAFNSTITVTLSGVPAKFNWCATSTDYPPNVSARTGTTNTFKGSKSFIVNGSAIAGNQFTGTINSLTDATGCPGCIGRDVAANANIPCCINLTAVGGYCRDLAADGASTYVGCGIEVEKNTRTMSAWGSLPCPSGWRPATISDYSCLWNNNGTNNDYYMIGGTDSYYITNESAGTQGHTLNAYCCTSCTASVWVFRAQPCSAWTACGTEQTQCGAYGIGSACAVKQCKSGGLVFNTYKCVR